MIRVEKLVFKWASLKILLNNHSCDSLAESFPAPAKAQRHDQVLLVGHSEQRNNHCQKKTAKLQQQHDDDAKQEEEASREAVAVLHLARG